MYKNDCMRDRIAWRESNSNTTTPTFPWVLEKADLMTNRTYLYDDELITTEPVDIMVTAHMGNSSCTSFNTVEKLGTIGNASTQTQIHITVVAHI